MLPSYMRCTYDTCLRIIHRPTWVEDTEDVTVLHHVHKIPITTRVYDLLYITGQEGQGAQRNDFRFGTTADELPN